MKKTQAVQNSPIKSTERTHDLKELKSLASRLEDRIIRITYELDRINKALDSFGKQEENNPASESKSNIIPFPFSDFFNADSRANSGDFDSEDLKPYMAMPGTSLPKDIPDYRPLLQRDGLILIAWDKRMTEAGDRYTAYWVTSTGTARFYASKQCGPENFPLAEPDHKSYAAEDGIEFYGQNAPVYIVHVAPELMMSNPRHGELRLAHIVRLKKEGSKVDFKYKYLLTLEKRRTTAAKKSHRAGA